MSNNDIKRAKMKRALARLEQRAREGDVTATEFIRNQVDTLDGMAYAATAREQMNPLQEMFGAVALSLLGGRPVAANAVLVDAVMRMHEGEPMGDILAPIRVCAGRDDARKGKSPEAPDVGYLSAYCDMIIEMEHGRGAT